MVKNRVLFGNNSLGGIVRCSLSSFSCILAFRWCNVVFVHGNMENVRNTCRCLRYSQTSGRISSVQWRKVVRITQQFTASAYLFLKLQQSLWIPYEFFNFWFCNVIIDRLDCLCVCVCDKALGPVHCSGATLDLCTSHL